ncbi:MAG: 50S ribosomal protein L10 [Phycisphaerales bacterium]|nr:50S ribosomal protein L10 [Phycisphaerales bacterium]
MSKFVKEMIVDEYRRRFDGVTGGVIVEIRGMDASTNNNFRRELHKKEIRVAVLKNSLARKAFEGGPLEQISDSLVGPTALVWGAESPVDVARELVDWAKTTESLELKAALLDGEFFEGKQGVRQLSTFPTREEAQATVVTLLLSPFKNVVGAATSPGSRILGVVKTIEEKLQDGEEIAKVG